MKKIISGMVILITIISVMSIFPSEVLASEGGTLEIENVEGIYYYRTGGYALEGGGIYQKYSINGKIVYCIEPGIPINTLDYVGEAGFVNSPYDDATNKLLELIGYYGYEYYGHNTLEYRMATQALIWENTGAEVVEYWTEAGGNGTLISVEKEKEEIMRLVNLHYIKPSFNNDTLDIMIGETITLEDTNGVLEEYQIYKSNGADVEIIGNKLKITSTSDTGDIEVFFIRKNYDNGGTTMVFTSDFVVTQKMGYFRVYDPVIANLNITTTGGSVTLNKLDSMTNSNVSQGDATLKGAVYGIYTTGGTLITKLTTDSNGQASSGAILEIGNYYLQEITAPEGYLIDTNKHFFEISKNSASVSLSVYEEIIIRDLEINKFYANANTGNLTPEVGIEFGIYNSKGEMISKLTTDIQGFAKTTLVYGTYTIKQLTTSFGHEMVKDFVVTVNENSAQTIKYSLSNAPVTAKLKLLKVDIDSGNLIAYAGAKFKIFNMDTNEYVCQSISYPTNETICIFETDENGEFTTPYPLTAGNYMIEEIAPPEGYVLSLNNIIFTINEDTDIVDDDEYGQYVEVIFYNEKIKGTITINKTGEKEYFEDNQIKYEDIALKGVKFGVYADEDIITLDGVTHYLKGDLVGYIITDENGIGSLDNLILGKYYIQEIETVDGYVLDDTIYYFELKADGFEENIVYESLDVHNKRTKGELEFTKTDFVTGETIKDTILEIYNDKDELVYRGATDENGKIVIKELPTGSYYIKEYEASTGYLITDEIVYFEVKENGEIVKATMSNKPITGTLEFTKTDFITGETLPNTWIEIYNDKDELIFSGLTDENGMIVIEELRYGRYYILEKEAPEGYVITDEKVYFEILENGEIVKATMTNEKVVIEVPNTESNKKYIVEILGGIILVIGIGIGVNAYAIKKLSRKEK